MHELMQLLSMPEFGAYFAGAGLIWFVTMGFIAYQICDARDKKHDLAMKELEIRKLVAEANRVLSAGDPEIDWVPD